jgi:hypothetical protein
MKKGAGVDPAPFFIVEKRRIEVLLFRGLQPRL